MAAQSVKHSEIQSDATERLEARLEFAHAICTLIIASEDDPPAFSRLNEKLQMRIVCGLRTLIEGAQADAELALQGQVNHG